jgi:hypothetical protein
MALPDPYISHSFEDADLDDLNDDGIELVTDHDMAAAGVGDWTAANSASLSKVSNGAGGNALRVAHGGASNPYATQSILTNGVHYKALVRARGDGVVNGDARLEGGTTNFYCPTPATFVDAAWEQPGGTLVMRAGSTATGAGEYTDYDSFSIKRMQKRYLDRSGNDHHMLRGDGYTATSLPAHNTGKGVKITAAAEYGKIPAGAPTGTQFSFTIAVKFPASTALMQIFDCYDGGDAGWAFLLNSGQVLQLYSGGFAGANAATYVIPNVVQHRQWVHLGGAYDGSNTKLYVNGLHVASAGTPLAPTFSGQNIWMGRLYNGTRPLLGTFYDAKVWQTTALTDAQHQEAYQIDRYRIARFARD